MGNVIKKTVRKKVVKKIVKVLVPCKNMKPEFTGIFDYPTNDDGTMQEVKSDFDIDAVVLYLNSNDLVWLRKYQDYIVENNISDTQWKSRLQSTDMLKWQLRGIAENMPYIRKVHLVVSNIEQVPEWVDREKVHVVLHKDIIPEKHLPTFNSCTIELFLHKIQDLAEHFVYFNDDMFVLKPLNPKNYFTDSGMPRNAFSMRGYCGLNKPQREGKYNYWFICKNSTQMAKKAAGMALKKHDSVFSTIPVHQFKPMQKKWFVELWDKIGDFLDNSISALRSNKNVSIYIFFLYAYYSRQTTNDNNVIWYDSFMHREKHLPVNLEKLDKHMCCCINTDNGKYLNAIRQKFDKPCKYEKENSQENCKA